MREQRVVLKHETDATLLGGARQMFCAASNHVSRPN
jgi:hypothetical protein